MVKQASLNQQKYCNKKGARTMSYHGKLQTLKNGTADAEIQQWAHNELAIAEINYENAERIIQEQKAEIEALKVEKEQLFLSMLDMALDSELKDLKYAKTQEQSTK